MGVHDGHRQRMRELYIEHGESALTDINMLELLLYYAIPRRDTNELAHALLEKFGSLDKVMKADIRDLAQVDGISENSAVLIRLVCDMQRRSAKAAADSITVISSTESAGRYFCSRLMCETDEKFLVLSLDTNNRITGLSNINEGSVNEVSVNIRKIVDNAVRNRASSVILCHNHPDGYVLPSQEDIDLTKTVCSALAPISINVLDHIIVSGEDYYSFADHGQL